MLKPIRVALGEVQSSILREILAQIARQQPDIEVVGRVSHHNLKEAIAKERADVLICDIKPDELPGVCRELFSEIDPPVVVGLARDGREAAICIPDAGAAQLMSVIRSAVLGTSEELIVERLSAGVDRDAAAIEPYASNAECIEDQLRSLDLALLAEVDTFASTQWDESLQRMQGLAISPEEVRALLKGASAPRDRRPSGELRWKRVRVADRAARRIAASIGRADAPPLVRLIERFGLGSFEQFCIVAALAVELDRNTYGKAFALLQDDVTHKHPSLDLLLRLYEGLGEGGRWDHAHAFDASRPLRRWSLLRLPARDPGDPTTTLGRRIELDERIARFVLGLEDLGAPLEEIATATFWEPDALRILAPRAIEERLVQLVAGVQQRAPGAPSRLVVHLHGRYGTGRRSLVAALCQRQGLRLVRVDAARLAALPAAAFEEALVLLTRESRLQPTALCLENVDPLIEDEAAPAPALRTIALGVSGFWPVVFFLGQRPWAPENLFQDGVFHSLALDLPSVADACRIWNEELADEQLGPDTGGAESAAHELAGRFQLSPGQIHDAIAAARTRALWEKPEGRPIRLADLYRGCREQCSRRLGAMARQVTTTFGWDDLILPPRQKSQLRELEAGIRNSGGVLQDWNFESRLPYGRGITALFSGPSGTGKTMAAGILARELGLDLFKIDLSRVVSKYIGETEKNLDRIFQQAEDANAMLFFDEADALFGKRSAIKDAHDRYANIEIAYLLQKMEERRGVTILATNLKTNMDEAFARRIRFGIEFPLPEFAQRLQIWEGSLPDEVRLANDVDLPILARRLRLSGGSIMNVCVGAASLAYEPGGTIGMKHLLHAAKRELQKLGHQYNENDFAAALTDTSAPGDEPDR